MEVGMVAVFWASVMVVASALFIVPLIWVADGVISEARRLRQKREEELRERCVLARNYILKLCIIYLSSVAIGVILITFLAFVCF